MTQFDNCYCKNLNWIVNQQSKSFKSKSSQRHTFSTHVLILSQIFWINTDTYRYFIAWVKNVNIPLFFYCFQVVNSYNNKSYKKSLKKKLHKYEGNGENYMEEVLVTIVRKGAALLMLKVTVRCQLPCNCIEKKKNVSLPKGNSMMYSVTLCLLLF